MAAKKTQRKWNVDDKDLAIVAIAVLGMAGMAALSFVLKDPTPAITSSITAVAALATGRKKGTDG